MLRTDGFTTADELDAVAPIPASAAAPPSPLASTAVPAPSLSAAALPLADALVVCSVAFKEASELASICAAAAADPSNAEAAERLMLASETAESVPKPALEPVASTLAVPFITPSSPVATPMSPSAVDVADAE
jgi:hypothetical protein